MNYLESLRRVEPSLKRDQIHSFPALSHIHPDYAAHPPAVDMERLKKARAAAVMERAGACTFPNAPSATATTAWGTR